MGSDRPTIEEGPMSTSGRRRIGSIHLKDGRVANLFAPTMELWQELNEIVYREPDRPMSASKILWTVADACSDVGFGGSPEDGYAVILEILKSWDKPWDDATIDDKMALRYRRLVAGCLHRYVRGHLDFNKLVALALDPPREFNGQCEEALWRAARGRLDAGPSLVDQPPQPPARPPGQTDPPSRSEEEKTGGSRPYIRDEATESRDELIYNELCKGTPEPKIRGQVNAHEGWGRLTTRQGIQQAAKRYAKRNRLSPPPARKPGRPRKGNGKKATPPR
jgi:hypothetical protein